MTALGWSTLVAKTSNAVLLSAIDAFAQKNGLVKDRFKADEGDEGVRVRSSDQPSRPEVSRAQTSTLPSWSEGLGGARDVSSVDLVPPAKGDAALSPPDDALLKELETPSRMEDGDWLENAVSVPASENGDDLELVIEPSLGSQPDHNEVTQIFQRDDELFPTVANGGEGEGGNVKGHKATLPGLPSGKRSNKTVPPPLPDALKPGGSNKH